MSNLKSLSPFTSASKNYFNGNKANGRRKKKFMKGTKEKKNDCEFLCCIVIFIYGKDAKNLKRRKKEEKHSPIHRSNESNKRIQRMIRFQRKKKRTEKNTIPKKSDLSTWKLDYKIQTFFILV